MHTSKVIIIELACIDKNLILIFLKGKLTREYKLGRIKYLSLLKKSSIHLLDQPMRHVQYQFLWYMVYETKRNSNLRH